MSRVDRKQIRMVKASLGRMDHYKPFWYVMYTLTRMWIGQGKPTVVGRFRFVQQI
jgi:hypothetical protein